MGVEDALKDREFSDKDMARRRRWAKRNKIIMLD